MNIKKYNRGVADSKGSSRIIERGGLKAESRHCEILFLTTNKRK
jgi:hypothetical protein